MNIECPSMDNQYVHGMHFTCICSHMNCTFLSGSPANCRNGLQLYNLHGTGFCMNHLYEDVLQVQTSKCTLHPRKSHATCHAAMRWMHHLSYIPTPGNKDTWKGFASNKVLLTGLILEVSVLLGKAQITV